MTEALHTTTEQTPPPANIKLAQYLEAKGIKKSWLAKQLGKVPATVTYILDGTIPIEPHKAQIEEILNIQL